MITLPIKDRNETYTLSPSKIICLGLNYHAHIQESHSVKVQGFTKEVPQEPVLFPKTPNTLIGSNAPIRLPLILNDYDFAEARTDYEAELGLVIKKEGKHIREEDAYSYILGYMCMNDVSMRNIQTGDRAGWFRGKSFDTFAPAGPCLVLHEDIGDPQNLKIECRHNGQTVQSANTSQMIFSIQQMLAFISRNFTLMPGDIIMTGTPAGVGAIKPGDIVEVEIEKIGILKNSVKKETLG